MVGLLSSLGGIHKQVSIMLNVNLILTQDLPPLNDNLVEHHRDHHNYNYNRIATEGPTVPMAGQYQSQYAVLVRRV